MHVIHFYSCENTCVSGGWQQPSISFVFGYFEQEMEKSHTTQNKEQFFVGAFHIPNHIFDGEWSEFCGRRHGVERMRSWHSMNIYFSGIILYSTCVERMVWWWWWYALTLPPMPSDTSIFVYHTICNVSNFSINRIFFRAFGALSQCAPKKWEHTNIGTKWDVRKYILYHFRYVSGMSVPTYRK